MRPILCILGFHEEVKRHEPAVTPGGNRVFIARTCCSRCDWALYGVGHFAAWEPRQSAPVGGSGIRTVRRPGR